MKDLRKHPVESQYGDAQSSKRWAWIASGAVVLLLLGTTSYIGPIEIVRGIWISVTEDTQYAPGYSERGFQSILIGESEASVRRALGTPLQEKIVAPYLRWLYTPDREAVDAFKTKGEYPDIRYSFTKIEFDEAGNFNEAFGQVSQGSSTTPLGTSASATIFTDGANSLSVSDAEIVKFKATKATPAEIEARFGKPQATFESKTVKWLRYSHSPASKNFRQRLIGIDSSGKVCRKVAEIWWD